MKTAKKKTEPVMTQEEKVRQEEGLYIFNNPQWRGTLDVDEDDLADRFATGGGSGADHKIPLACFTGGRL